MNLQQQEQFYQMMTRLRSRAASSKDDVRITEMVDGVLVSKPAKKIEYISEAATTSEPEAQVWNLTAHGPVLQKESKAASTEYEVVKKYYDMGGSSTGDQIYKCGIHDYETRSLKEFNEHIALSHNDNDSGSKAASVSVSVSVPGINKMKAIQDFMFAKRY